MDCSAVDNRYSNHLKYNIRINVGFRQTYHKIISMTRWWVIDNADYDMFMSWLASSVKVHIQCLIIGCTYGSEFSVIYVSNPPPFLGLVFGGRANLS